MFTAFFMKEFHVKIQQILKVDSHSRNENVN